MAQRRLRASRSARGRALRFYARESDAPDQLASEVIAVVRSFRNPVLRLRIIETVMRLDGPLRAQRRETVAELRSQSWTWAEIGEQVGTGKERAWQIYHGR